MRRIGWANPTPGEAIVHGLVPAAQMELAEEVLQMVLHGVFP
jgi:hypothetical protein